MIEHGSEKTQEFTAIALRLLEIPFPMSNCAAS